MPMPRALDSAGEANWTTSPRSTISPSSGVWTPERIFIRVLLPAPFSPTSPWISPGSSSKSTPSRAVAPPKRLVTPRSARIGSAASTRVGKVDVAWSALSKLLIVAISNSDVCAAVGDADEARTSDFRLPTPLVLHVVVEPDVSGRIVLGDRSAISTDKLRHTALGHVGAGDRQIAGPDGAAVDAAARVDDRCQQLVREDRFGSILQPIDADQQHLVLLSGGLDHALGGERHVIRVEEPALHVREALQQVLPERGDLLDLPVAGRLVDDLDIRVILQGLVETFGSTLRPGVGELALGVDHLPLATHRLEELVGNSGAHIDVVWLEIGQMPEFRELGGVLHQPGVHVDQRDTLGDDLVRGVDQRVAGRGMHGDEIKILRRDRLQILQLLLDAELTIERGDLDTQQVAEEFGRLHAMRDPR